MDLETRVERARAYFERVHREVFDGDPAANPGLRVDVVEPEVVEGIDTFVLITPWTVNGMAFTDGDLPDRIDLGEKSAPMFLNELDEVGRYGSVSLLSEVTCVASMEAVYESVARLAPLFREGVRSAIRQPPDPDRRALLTGRFGAG